MRDLSVCDTLSLALNHKPAHSLPYRLTLHNLPNVIAGINEDIKE